jgi:hypothetical protein
VSICSNCADWRFGDEDDSVEGKGERKEKKKKKKK